MKTIKKVALLLVILLLVLFLGPILCIGCGWAIVLGGMYLFTPTPPQPKIQSGEFPFELTYKLNGELYTIEDIYICNYDGIGFNEGYGKYRKWNGYIKDYGKSAILITEDSDRQIFCFVGDAEYYMNDEKYPEKRPLTPRLYNVEKRIDVDSLSPDEISEFYNIEIVSWNFSDPIDNSFE